MWTDISGYEGLYQISPVGLVKSLFRYRKGKRGGLTPVEERILKPGMIDGYKCVRLCKDGKCKMHSVAVLVLATFVGPRPPGMQCRHLDDNRLNNNLSNLAWGTQKQNAEDRDRNGKTYRREKHPNHKLTNEIVGFIRDRAKELPRYGRTPIIRDEVEKTFGVALGKYIVNAAINYRVWKD